MASFNATWNKEVKDKNLQVGKSNTGNLSFIDIWASREDPKLRKKLLNYYQQKTYERQAYDAIVQKRLEEEQKQTDSKNSLIGKTKGFGEALYNQISGDFKRVGSGTAEVLSFGKGDVGKQQLAESLQITGDTQLLAKVNAELRNPKTPAARRIRLKRVAAMLNAQVQDTTGKQTEGLAQTIERTDPIKGASSVVNIGLLAGGGATARAAGLGTGVKLSQMGAGQLARAALVGGTEGAIGGASMGAQSIDWKAPKETKDILGFSVDKKIVDMYTNIAIGGAIGTAIPLATAGVARTFGKPVAREIPLTAPTPKSQAAAQIITDYNHLLPEVGTGKEVSAAKLVTQIEKDPALAVIARGANPTDINKLKTIEKSIARAQKFGGLSPEEARNLLVERRAVLERIRNPQTVISEQLDKVDSALASATSKADIEGLTKQKAFIQEQAISNARAQSVAEQLNPPVSNTKLNVNSQARKTEALAVQNGITEGFDNMPTYNVTNMQDQMVKVLGTMDEDYDVAKRIALGQVQPPEGVLPNAFYRGVEARAIRENDSELLRQLATESTLVQQSTQQGKNIAALAIKNPDSPLDSLKAIMSARKSSKLNIPKTVTPEEAKNVTELANKVAVAREAVAGGADRLEYGRARVAMDDYVSTLVENTKKASLKDALKDPFGSVVKVGGISKSMRATLDNSGLLRQGWKTLTTHPITWSKNSAKSFSDLVRAFGDRPVLNELRADIISRPNSMNGMYKKMGLDVFGIAEEAFPSTLPEKIPGFRRLFNASDAAYTGFNQRSRADIADIYLNIAQKSGVDLTSKKELTSIGKLANSLTSRGHLGNHEKAAEALNNLFFSPRLLKSNVDVLTAHTFQKGVTPFVRKQAAINLTKIVTSTAAVLATAEAVRPGSVEWDPRSANFGKIRIGDTRFDVSGGMGGVVTLASRLIKQSTKSSTTGIVTPLNSGDFGSQSTMDVIYSFFENKLAPAPAVARDFLKGQDFDGNKPTASSTAKNLLMPLIINNYQELNNNPRSANLLAGMIAEGLGISTNTYSINTNWNKTSSKTLTQFRRKVGDKKFAEANNKYNESFNSWFEAARTDRGWNKLSMDERKDLISKKRYALRDDIIKSYGFKYKYQPKDNATQSLINELSNLK